MYTKQFFDYSERLNIRRPKVVVPATECIDEMVDFVGQLETKGYTYVTSDGVYFDASKFPQYNKLSKQPIQGNKAGARVDIGEKRNAHDFALWKFVHPNSLQYWKSPWSEKGCPGWHIECSAIARKFLGDTFDIHTGGVDHITIHHTNEIAQSEALTGKEMSKFWMHNEHMKVDDGKMSKSIGNVYNLDGLLAKGYSALSCRYLFLQSHYRSILNFTFEALTGAQSSLRNLVAQLAKHVISNEVTLDKKLVDGINEALMDDLNTPKALGLLWDLVKTSPSRAVYDFVIKLDDVLSLDLKKSVEELLAPKQIPSEIKDLADKRIQAKANKDYKTADELRKRIADMGYEILDTKDGYEIKLL